MARANARRIGTITESGITAEEVRVATMIDMGLALLQIGCGILLADFASGVFHWLEDAYGQEDWPIIGKTVIEPNIRHHYSPLDFTRVSYWRRNRPIIILGLILLGVLIAADWLNIITLTFLFAASQANETHRWAHIPSRKTPKIVRSLQKTGAFLSSKNHWRHHRKPFRVHYCTITNLVNPIVDGVGLFPMLELVIWRLFGVKPREDTGLPPVERTTSRDGKPNVAPKLHAR